MLQTWKFQLSRAFYDNQTQIFYRDFYLHFARAKNYFGKLGWNFECLYHADTFDTTFSTDLELLNAKLFIAIADRLFRCPISLPRWSFQKALERNLHFKMGKNGRRCGRFWPLKLDNTKQGRITFKTLALRFFHDNKTR